MSERLSLAGIREGAMSPPAGSAAGAEDFLWNQLLRAREDERQAELAPLREASNRALHRSGWYNVGSMLMPQDAGDVALSAAMGPGLGRLSRVALAALGGMTTQVGDAEGAFLPQDWFRRMLTSTSRATREEGARGVQAINDASRALEREGLPGRRGNPALSDEEYNALFPRMLDISSNYGVLPQERGLSALLTPGRDRNYQGLLDDWRAVRGSGQVSHVDRNWLVADPWLEAARPPPGLSREGRVSLYPDLPSLGSYHPNDGSIRLNADQSAEDLLGVFDHETQHWIQSRNPARARVGSSPSAVQAGNPELYQEYYDRLLNPPNAAVPGWSSVGGGLDPYNAGVSARHQLYENNFGEWEARLAQAIGQRQASLGHDMSAIEGLIGGLDEFLPSNAWPDFRVR